MAGEESAAQVTAFGRVVAAISDRRNFREQQPAVRDRRYSRGLESQAVYQEIVTSGPFTARPLRASPRQLADSARRLAL